MLGVARNSFVGGAVVILFVSIVLVILSQTEPKSNYVIETVSAVCATSETNDMTIVSDANSIVVTAPLTTPNPCYYAGGSVNFRNNDIKIELVPLPKQGVCVQCIGEVTGKVVIQNLTKGNYGVDVRTPDKAAITTIMIE